MALWFAPRAALGVPYWARFPVLSGSHPVETRTGSGPYAGGSDSRLQSRLPCPGMTAVEPLLPAASHLLPYERLQPNGKTQVTRKGNRGLPDSAVGGGGLRPTLRPLGPWNREINLLTYVWHDRGASEEILDKIRFGVFAIEES